MYSGTYTIKNRETGDYKTFLIKKEQPQDSSFFPGKQLVGLLTGPDNYSDFRLFGYVNDDGNIIVFKKHRGDSKPSDFDWFARILNQLLVFNDPGIVARYEVLESRNCRRCGRKLTTPESIEQGIGPECRSKVGLAIERAFSNVATEIRNEEN